MNPIRGRTDLTCKHIRGCRHVPRDHEAMTAARGGADVSRKHRSKNATASKAATVGPMDAHVARPSTARTAREIENDLLGVLLYCSIVFNILDTPTFRAFLKNWVAGMKNVPSRRSLSTTVLERVLLASAAVATSA